MLGQLNGADFYLIVKPKTICSCEVSSEFIDNEELASSKRAIKPLAATV